MDVWGKRKLDTGLPEQDLGLTQELVGGHLQVEGGGAAADATGAVVVRAVARAEPAVVIAGVGNGHTAKMGAHTKDNQPGKGRTHNVLAM